MSETNNKKNTDDKPESEKLIDKVETPSSGLSWLLQKLTNIDNYFQTKARALEDRIDPSDGARAFNPACWFVGLGGCTLSFVTRAVALPLLTPVALVKDVVQLCRKPMQSVCSIALTPFFCVLGTPLMLLASAGCVLAVVLICIVIVVVSVYLGIRFVIEKCLYFVGEGVGAVIQTAVGKKDDDQ